MTPCLRSARLILHPYTPILVKQEHVDWLNDKDLMSYSEQRLRPHTMITQMEYAGSANPDRHLWLIRCDGVDIGSISAHVDGFNRRANLGILIGRREYQGQQMAAEAWCTVIDWLFENDIHRVECGHRGDNERMRRLAFTTGFTHEAEIPGYFRKGDSYESLVLWGRFKHDVFHSKYQKIWQAPYWGTGASS